MKRWSVTVNDRGKCSVMWSHTAVQYEGRVQCSKLDPVCVFLNEWESHHIVGAKSVKAR